MAGPEHHYQINVRWTGNTGSGTSGYRDYARDHEVSADGVGTLHASSDPAFRGDAAHWNPEQLFLSSIAQCHMLWFLHLAAAAGQVVQTYDDHATATMRQDASGGGEFVSVTLHPRVHLRSGHPDEVDRLHAEVHRYCFIARSVAVPIKVEPHTELVPVSGTGLDGPS